MIVEENVASDASTVLVRMTEFYGLSREDWLSLVIKVGPCVPPGLMIVLLCSHGQTRERSSARDLGTYDVLCYLLLSSLRDRLEADHHRYVHPQASLNGSMRTTI